MDNRLSKLLKETMNLQKKVGEYKKTQSKLLKAVEKVNKCQEDSKKKATMKNGKGKRPTPKRMGSPKKANASMPTYNRPMRRTKA